MCPKHWFALPERMRDAVWAAYVPGQEVRKDPSAQYLLVTREAVEYLEDIERRQGQFPVFVSGATNVGRPTPTSSSFQRGSGATRRVSST